MMRIIILVLLGGLAGPAAAQNLLTNGDFETGDLTGWTAWQGWGTGITRTADVAEPGRLGAYCLKLSAAAFANFGVYQEVPVTPGRTYRIDAYWRGVCNSNQTWYEILLIDGPYSIEAAINTPRPNFMYAYDIPELPPPVPSFGWIWAHDQNTTPVDEQWPEHDDGKRTATGNTMTVVLKAGTNGFTSVSAFFDDVSLVRVVSADFDRDADVDLADFSIFQNCFNGPNRPLRASCGADADFDGDGDTDLADFSVFQGCFSGPNRPSPCD